MAGLNHADREFAEALSRLVYCNPFSPDRVEHERAALGDAFEPMPRRWSLTEAELAGDRPNVVRLRERVEALVDRLRGRALPDPDRRLYEDLALYLLYDRYRLKLTRVCETGASTRVVKCWDAFAAEFAQLDLRGHEPAHVFACFFQIRRAFSNIFYYLVGRSRPAGGLREAVWESIFTHDFQRYYRHLYRRMGDMATLVLGGTGTGKELVARAIGRSRYIPFDVKTRRFTEDFAGSFLPVNLSALSPTLIESELFGHQRGAFTGAAADRAGWLETCPPLGTVFLDEVGELDPTIQVKLLRVLQARTFQRLGGVKPLRFEGKIIAATNRDLEAGIRDGGFREDFYYRLCSDVIRTPTLREQLDDTPGDLDRMVRFILNRLMDEVEDAAAADVRERVLRAVGAGYAWPGNFRELEQCVRNILIRGTYTPRRPRADGLTEALRRADCTADELLNRYCAAIYGQTGSYVQAARRLGLDRRTVKARIDESERE